MITLRQEIADFYNNEFSKLQIEFPGIEIPVYEPRIWYRYVIYCKTIIANKIIKELHSNGIAADRPIENWMNEKEIKHYYNSSFAYNHLVSLPMYPTLKKAERKAVVNAVKKTLQRLFI
jgi:dTDP-4-amino-4,6-dideoxygalactose transaminase